MSVYTLDHCVTECAANKLSRLQVPKGQKKKEILLQIWEAFCGWVLYQLQRGKGCSVPIFARIGWEIYTVGRNQKKKRPFFCVTESFARGNGVQGMKEARPSEGAAGVGMSVSTVSMPSGFTSLEEINFTKIAIKYSKSLTKDLVFTGLRDIFHKLGAAISQGRTVKFEFPSIGILMSKDMRLAFQFDLVNVTINNNLQASGTSTHEMNDSMASIGGTNASISREQGEIVEPNQSARSSASTVPPLDLSRTVDTEDISADVKVVPTDEYFTNEQIHQGEMEQEASNEMASQAALSDDGNSFDRNNGILSIDPNPARVKAVEDAWNRQLNEVKEKLDEENREFEMLDEQHRQREIMAAERREMIRNEKLELQNFIRGQMKLKDEERAREIKEHRDAKNGHFLPLEETQRQRSREKMKKDLLLSLQDQISEKSERSKTRMEREREEERRFLDHVAYEMNQYKAQKEAISATQQKELKDAWQRDGFMKRMLREHRNAMKKHQMAASRKYQTSDASGSVGGGQSLGRSPSQNSDYSIGFDMRAKSRQS